MAEARKFTAEDRQEIIRRYEDGDTIRIIAREYCCSEDVRVRMMISRVLHQAGLDVMRCSRPKDMPSEEEIWGVAPGETDASKVSSNSRTAEIQRRWSDEERRRRAGCSMLEVDQPQKIESWEGRILKEIKRSEG
jgi:hypothetical protein